MAFHYGICVATSRVLQRIDKPNNASIPYDFGNPKSDPTFVFGRIQHHTNFRTVHIVQERSISV